MPVKLCLSLAFFIDSPNEEHVFLWRFAGKKVPKDLGRHNTGSSLELDARLWLNGQH